MPHNEEPGDLLREPRSSIRWAPYSGPNRARADPSCSQTAEACSPCRNDLMTIMRTPTTTSAAGRTQRRRFLGISAIATMHPAGRVSRRSIVTPPQPVVKVMIGVIGHAIPVPPTTYCQPYDPGPHQQHVDEHARVGQVDPKVSRAPTGAASRLSTSASTPAGGSGCWGLTDEHGADWGHPEGKGRAGLYVRELTRWGVLEALAARRVFASRIKGLPVDAALTSLAAGSKLARDQPAARMGTALAHHRSGAHPG
jgi:hypothetical protein